MPLGNCKTQRERPHDEIDRGWNVITLLFQLLPTLREYLVTPIMRLTKGQVSDCTGTVANSVASDYTVMSAVCY